jgi:uncharacterized protein YndB with AHSA1/START domain
VKDFRGPDLRRVERREHLGQAALVVIVERHYETTVDDLWNALTTPERLARWFLPVEGDLRLGGRYQLRGNAGGTITRCDPPAALDLTWEFGGATSWVSVRLSAAGADRALLALEHVAHEGSIGEEHLKRFGPGAVGIGWDLAIGGLAWHFADAEWAADPAWVQTDEAKAFMRASGDAWGDADMAAGEDAAEARAKAERTVQAYTGG